MRENCEWMEWNSLCAFDTESDQLISHEYLFIENQQIFISILPHFTLPQTAD